MTSVRTPRLLKPSGSEYERLNPSALEVQTALWSLSTARMTLPEGEPVLRVRDLVEIFGPGGSFGYFRVSSITTDPGIAQNVDLEHSIAMLEDDLTPAETTLTGTMKQIMTKILGYQYDNRWRLGDVESTETGLELVVDHDNLREALVSAVKLVDGYGIFSEQTNSSWKIHVRKLPESPSCECRVSRNATDVSIEIDDHDLCTRVVSDKLPDGALQVAETEWGVVSHVLNIPAGATEAQALRYANDYLKQHKEPTVSIGINALVLAELTGEKWDAFELGGMCRAALPDWGIVQDKQIITMDYADLLNNPDSVHLTLAAPERRIEEISASNSRSAGGASRAANDAQNDIVVVGDTITLLANDVNGALIRLDAAEKSILLKADKIDLVGYVTASQLAAELASINTAIATKIVTSEISAAIAKFTKLTVDDVEVKPRTVKYLDDNGNAASMVVLTQ